MSCETGHLNIENLVRSGVVLAVGLPVALSLGGLTGAATRVLEQNASNPTASATDTIKSKLAEPCVRYMLSKNDSKLERDAMNDIDDIMGGAVDYSNTCNWAF